MQYRRLYCREVTDFTDKSIEKKLGILVNILGQILTKKRTVDQG